MVKGNASREDYEQFIQDHIVTAVDEFLVSEASVLIPLLTYRQQVPRGQESFIIPVKKRTSHGMELLGEYGRASYIHTERDSLSFTVQRKALSLLLTEDGIAKAVEEGVVDAVQNELNNAFLEVADEYADTLKTVLLDGWADGTTDAPTYADRTFVAHDHIVDAVELDAAATVTGGAAGALTKKVLRQARHLVMEHGEDADLLIVPPQAELDIIELMEAQGTGVPLLPATISGSIGRIYGMDIMVTPWMPDGRFVVTGRRRKPIVFGEREKPELRQEFRELDRQWDAQIHASWVFGMVHKFAGATVTYNGDVDV